MSTQENGALLADDEKKLREALAAGPTPGPWRWEFNASSKDVSLVGGRVRYDVTVMDFTRWGMGGAVPRFVEPTDIPNGLQLLHKLSDRKDWIAPFPDREHHADWCAQVTHPDARWMQEAAPDRITRLLDELQRLRAENERLHGEVATEREACAQVCESHMDKAELQRAEQRASEARERGDMQGELARMKHWSTVSTFNAGLRNAAAAIRARGEPAATGLPKG